jgi:hypothetical protein
MNALLQTPLTHLQSHLQSLLTTLTSTPTAAPSVKIASDLLAADNALTASLVLLRTHQSNYARILELRREVQGLEDRIKERVRGLEDVRGEAMGVGGGESSDEEEEDEGDVRGGDEMDSGEGQGEGNGNGRRKEGVDYKTLMAFSRRIGRFPDGSAGAQAQIPTITLANGASTQATNGTQPLSQLSTTTAPFSALSTLDPAVNAWLDHPALIHNLGLSAPFPDADKIRSGLLGAVQCAIEDGEDGERVVRELMGIQDPEGTGAGDGDAEMGGMTAAVARRVSFGPASGVGGGAGRVGASRAPQEEKKGLGKLELWDSESDEED